MHCGPWTRQLEIVIDFVFLITSRALHVCESITDVAIDHPSPKAFAVVQALHRIGEASMRECVSSRGACISLEYISIAADAGNTHLFMQQRFKEAHESDGVAKSQIPEIVEYPVTRTGMRWPTARSALAQHIMMTGRLRQCAHFLKQATEAIHIRFSVVP